MKRHRNPLCAALLVILTVFTCWAQHTNPGTASNSGYVGNQVCAKCHAAIAKSYAATQMANASGPATENFMPGEFHHQKSGVDFRIRMEDGKVWLDFDRPGDTFAHGRREFFEFIGQGRRGRTYLFSEDGFVFESPVNWYGDRKMWDMAPAYTNAREIPMNLPALTSCLECHSSGFQLPVAGTENRYKLPIAAFPGVTCERCHGPGAAHANGSGSIVNPVKLSAARRDAVCMQCHLEGDAAIERAGKHLYDYRPGDDLSNFIRYYVATDSHGSALGATSQFEALSQSVCKKKSGDSMSCMSCHDPHRVVSDDERVAFYRAKCIACHGEKFAARHHNDRPDCTACHMPASQSKNIAHTQVTDHRIPARPSLTRPADVSSLSSTPKLVPFPYSAEADASARDKALAWETLAQSGIPGAEAEAERLLKPLAADSSDAAVLSAVAYLAQKRGDTDQARSLYRKALTLEPGLIEAENNLGTLEAQSGNVREAARLWADAFQRAPGRSSLGMNLAYEFCVAGKFDVARNYTLRVLQFNPDLDIAKRMLNGLNAVPAKCVR